MNLGLKQNNSLFGLTMDVWEDKVYFEARAYEAGYFAAERGYGIHHAGTAGHDPGDTALSSDRHGSGGRDAAEALRGEIPPSDPHPGDG